MIEHIWDPTAADGARLAHPETALQVEAYVYEGAIPLPAHPDEEIQFRVRPITAVAKGAGHGVGAGDVLPHRDHPALAHCEGEMPPLAVEGVDPSLRLEQALGQHLLADG